jgi:hypothetical protein
MEEGICPYKFWKMKVRKSQSMNLYNPAAFLWHCASYTEEGHIYGRIFFHKRTGDTVYT